MPSRVRNPNRKPVLVHMSPALIQRLDRAKEADLRSRNAEIVVLLESALAERGID